MAKTFITSGTGASQTLDAIQNEKVPVYSTRAAAEADLANIEEGAIVATKDTGAEFPDIKEYIRNQNILDDWETITVSSDSSNPTVMPYDGFLELCFQGEDLKGSVIYVNGELISDFYIVFRGVSMGEGNTFAVTHHIPVKKGDRIYKDGLLTMFTSNARYYKLRDYTGR